MPEFKLPLPRVGVEIVGLGDTRWKMVEPDDVESLERAYAELQERHNKMCDAHDRAESERLTAIGKQMAAEQERDEARAKVEKLEAALELSSVGWQDHYKDLATARAEVARLKRIEEAAKAWADDHRKHDNSPGYVARTILSGHGPDGEVKT